jgi:hypothetical protein
MEQLSHPTEVFILNPPKSLGRIYLDWMPQPGNYVEIEDKTYRVLERRHNYQLKRGRYCLCRVTVYVQPAEVSAEMTLIGGCWVIGDVNCKFNAHSELLRCAINPLGPCQGCTFRES